MSTEKRLRVTDGQEEDRIAKEYGSGAVFCQDWDRVDFFPAKSASYTFPQLEVLTGTSVSDDCSREKCLRRFLVIG